MFELKPHQEEAVAKMHNGCILCGGVGVGKSHTAVGYYLQNEAPKPVYVITTARKRDTMDWQWLWAEVGMNRDPELTQGAVVEVDSWNNIGKYTEVKDAFFIFDEQRLVGSGAWVKSFYKIAKANRWILLSATPGDNWLDYVPVFVANGFVRNKTHFCDDHVIWKAFRGFREVDRYRQVGRLVRWRNQLLVNMPYERHTVRHHHDVDVTYDSELLRKVLKERWHVYENRPLTGGAELVRVAKRVVYSADTRLLMVRKLLTRHPKLIVFYNHDFELEILRTIDHHVRASADHTADTPVPTVAEWNGHKHEEIPKTDSWVYLVQYVAGAEAWETHETDAMVLYSLPHSYKIYSQCLGRIDRLTTKYVDLHYYTLWANTFYERRIRSALRAKKSFNESAFSELTWTENTYTA